MHKKLFIPGPTEVREEIRKEMARPSIGHRSKEYTDLHTEVAEKLKKLFYTKNHVLLSTSSGTGFMEAAIRSCVNKKVLHLVCGHFSEVWYDISVGNGKPNELFKVADSEGFTPDMVREKLETGAFDTLCLTHNETSTGVMNPLEEIAKVMKDFPDVLFMVDTVSSMGGVKIEVDKLGIDVCLTSSQKCLAIPPGLSVGSVSDKALERVQKVPNRGYYFDIQRILKYHLKSQTMSTPAIPQIYALNKELDYMFEETLDKRFQRHKDMAELTRKWALKNYELFPKEGFRSNTLTVITNNLGKNVAGLNDELGKRGMMISNGYGDLKEKTFRIAHMGDLQLFDMKELLDNIDEIWQL